MGKGIEERVTGQTRELFLRDLPKAVVIGATIPGAALYYSLFMTGYGKGSFPKIAQAVMGFGGAIVEYEKIFLYTTLFIDAQDVLKKLF